MEYSQIFFGFIKEPFLGQYEEICGKYLDFYIGGTLDEYYCIGETNLKVSREFYGLLFGMLEVKGKYFRGVGEVVCSGSGETLGDLGGSVYRKIFDFFYKVIKNNLDFIRKGYVLGGDGGQEIATVFDLLGVKNEQGLDLSDFIENKIIFFS